MLRSSFFYLLFSGEIRFVIDRRHESLWADDDDSLGAKQVRLSIGND